LEELKNKTRSKNNFVLFRHGESEANISDILSFEIGKNGDKLTLDGKKKVEENSKDIFKTFSDGKNNNGEKIDIIISSPFNRTKETSKIIKKELNFDGEIIFDDRLRETNFGEENNGKSNNIFREKILENNFDYKIKLGKDGESYFDINKRVQEFLYEIDKKYDGKNILIISHHLPTAVILRGVNCFKNRGENRIENSEPYFLDFAPIPHNKDFELDYHKPYIDKISFTENNKKYEFIGDVFDC
jgi:broad specificity phosphatase PhoE